MGKKKKTNTGVTVKGGSPGDDFTGPKNKYDVDWPPPVNINLPKV